MADSKITQLDENTTPLLTDLLAIVDDPGSSPATQKIKIANLFSTLNLPEGYMINGKIVPSVASNNLTVALKGMDGNDPSATNPVMVRIGGVVRVITSALSKTVNAGVGTFHLEAATIPATFEEDYFVYLGYNATDGVVLGFSRIPYAEQYNDFSTTAVDDKYCAISTITNAAATDQYVNIGRFAATLSVTPGFNWSVPTFTPKNLIQRPIFETRILTFKSIWWFGLTAEGNGTQTSYYQIHGRRCDFRVHMLIGSTTTFDANAIVFGHPIYSVYYDGLQNTPIIGQVNIFTTGVSFTGYAKYEDSGESILYVSLANGTYSQSTPVIGGSVPAALSDTNEIHINGSLDI